MSKAVTPDLLDYYMSPILQDLKSRLGNSSTGGSTTIGGVTETATFKDLSLLTANKYTVKNTDATDNATGYIMTGNLLAIDDVADTTANGITYSITDGKIKISGTCTAWMSIPLLTLPSCLIGKLIEVKLFALVGTAMTNSQCYLATGANDEDGNFIGVWLNHEEKRIRVGSLTSTPIARIAIAEGTTVDLTYGCMIRVIDDSVDSSEYVFPKEFVNGTRQTFTGSESVQVTVDKSTPIYIFNSASTSVSYTSDKTTLTLLSQLKNDVGYITADDVYNANEKALRWKGKKICFYGDSLTYLQDNLGDSGKWAEQVGAYFGATAYARGKGGANVRMYYQDSASKDTYFDANGKTVGTLAESADGLSHQASFCSWDRIKNSMTQIMFDVIVVMGGTNDFNGNVGEGTLAWSASNTSDVDWVADTEYYNGGDFDISTFKGGLASTIMKLRLVQPQARIVIATLHNGQIRISDTGTATTNRTELPKDTNGKTIIDMANWTKDVADYMGCDFINMVEKIGFSVFNRSGYFVDQVHLTVKGRKNMANGLIGGLECIKAFESV